MGSMGSRVGEESFSSHPVWEVPPPSLFKKITMFFLVAGMPQAMPPNRIKNGGREKLVVTIIPEGVGSQSHYRLGHKGVE